MKITVIKKSTKHPYYNKGSALGYVIDGHEGGLITVRKGKTYHFDQSHPSNVNHEVMISMDPDGKYPIPRQRRNMSSAGKPGSNLKFEIPADAPNILYYVCVNHAYMGGYIHCVA